MGWLFFLLAAVLFFFAGIGVTIIPNPTVWGLFCLALGHFVGGSCPWIIKRGP